MVPCNVVFEQHGLHPWGGQWWCHRKQGQLHCRIWASNNTKAISICAPWVTGIYTVQSGSIQTCIPARWRCGDNYPLALCKKIGGRRKREPCELGKSSISQNGEKQKRQGFTHAPRDQHCKFKGGQWWTISYQRGTFNYTKPHPVHDQYTLSLIS
jgi:hypothetical protein